MKKDLNLIVNLMDDSIKKLDELKSKEKHIFKTAEEVQNYIIKYLDECIKHHQRLMEENALNNDFYYADKHKTLRDCYIGEKCQMSADFD